VTNQLPPPSRLRLARLRARLTQRELADLAGVSQQIVSQCEQSDRPHVPGPRVQRKLAAALDIDADSLWPVEPVEPAEIAA
jgi:transcriptional regulator with XRE-family HTH domain